jgi:hypothetical protein
MLGMNGWKRMSASGSIDKTRRRGTLTFTVESFAEALPKRYPKARWPTANKSVPLLVAETEYRLH